MDELTDGPKAKKGAASPKPKTPDDFDSLEDFMTWVRRLYNEDAGADKINREEAAIDARFAAGEQWDPVDYQKRITARKPALTFNLLTAFIAQLIGNRRLNETEIKVIPDHDSDKEVARVREGIIRNIQKSSNAKRAYDVAFQNQVIGGLGNFQVVLEYADDDVFEQNIAIAPIHNDRAVTWDKLSFDPTGADARHVFVTDRVSRSEFKQRWPEANIANFEQNDEVFARYYTDGWLDQDTVRVADFWRVRTRKRRLAMMSTGKVLDVTDLADEEWMGDVYVRANGEPVIRVAQVKYAEMYRVSGAEILEGPYEMPIKRVPVFRVPGWEINTGDYRTRFGLIRWLRDPQRFHNYWLSMLTEKMMLSPRAKWLIGKSAGQGYEDAFRRSHLSDDPVLFWNDESANKPEYVQPVQLEAALIQQIEFSANALKSISNMHEANFGQRSNEVSGRAITARQRVGEQGVVIYTDNLNMAIEEAGRVINDLIPTVYDTPRVLKVLGGDDDISAEFVKVNFDEPGSIDITTGKYSITVVSGPSYATKRVEAAESMMAAVNAMPDTFAVAGDLIAEAQDWPKADKIAQRLRDRMGVQDPEDMTPEQRQQAQAAAQAQAEAAEIAKQKELAEIDYRKAQAEEARARAAAAIAAIDREDVKTEAEVEKTEAETDSLRTGDDLKTLEALTGEKNDGKDSRKPRD